MTRRKTGEQTHARRSHRNPKPDLDQLNIGDRILVAETGQCKGNQVHGSLPESHRRCLASTAARKNSDEVCGCCVAAQGVVQRRFVARLLLLLRPPVPEGSRDFEISVDPPSIRIYRTDCGKLSRCTTSTEPSLYVNHIAATVNPRQPRNTPCMGHEATARPRSRPARAQRSTAPLPAHPARLV